MKTPIISLRLDEGRQLEIQIALERRATQPACEPWTVTDFIRAAIDEKLRHMHRSRTKRRKQSDNVRYTIAAAEDVQGGSAME